MVLESADFVLRKDSRGGSLHHLVLGLLVVVVTESRLALLLHRTPVRGRRLLAKSVTADSCLNHVSFGIVLVRPRESLAHILALVKEPSARVLTKDD